MFINRSKNEQSFISGLKRNDYVSNICESMSDMNDSKHVLHG